MTRVIVETDDGKVIDALDFPNESTYALVYMPGCPSNVRVHGLLNWLRRTMEDAATGGHVERLSEKAMRLAQERT